MNRYAHGPYAAAAESSMMPRRRDASDTGPSDVNLIPSPERLAGLLARMRSADHELEVVQGNVVVSADFLQRAAEAGHPEASHYLGALQLIEARRRANVQPPEAA